MRQLGGILLQLTSSALSAKIGRKHKYLTTRHTFQIYGVCEKCQKKRKRPVAVVPIAMLSLAEAAAQIRESQAFFRGA